MKRLDILRENIKSSRKGDFMQGGKCAKFKMDSVPRWALKETESKLGWLVNSPRNPIDLVNECLLDFIKMLLHQNPAQGIMNIRNMRSMVLVTKPF